MIKALSFIRPFVAVTVAAICSSVALQARADTTVLNTFIEPGNFSNGAGAVVWEEGYINLIQKLGVEFTISTATELTSILLALNGTGSFNVGIESGASGMSGNYYPTSSFLYKSMLTDPISIGVGSSQTNPLIDVSALHWDLAPGVYFLVAEAAALNGASGYWGYGTPTAHGVVSVQNSPWFDAPTFAANIDSVQLVSSVPEPQQWLMLLLGLCVLSRIARPGSRHLIGK